MSARQDFWSRRKAAVQAEAKAEALALEEQVIAERQAELEEKDDAEILAEVVGFAMSSDAQDIVMPSAQ